MDKLINFYILKFFLSTILHIIYILAQRITIFCNENPLIYWEISPALMQFLKVLLKMYFGLPLYDLWHPFEQIFGPQMTPQSFLQEHPLLPVKNQRWNLVKIIKLAKLCKQKPKKPYLGQNYSQANLAKKSWFSTHVRTSKKDETGMIRTANRNVVGDKCTLS